MSKTLSDRVLAYLTANPGASQRSAAEACGCSRRLIRQVQQRNGIRATQVNRPAHPAESTTWDERDDSATLTIDATRIRTAEEALKHAGVDMGVWEVERQLVNSWEGFYKSRRRDAHTVVPLFQVKIWLRRRKINLTEIADSIVARMERHAPKYKKIRRKKTDDVMLEMAIADLHYGKYAWGDETGTDYDHEIAERVAQEAVDDLLAATAHVRPELILLPTGNDLLHVDNLNASTTAGTRQDVDTRLTMLFDGAVAMLVSIIDRLREIAPVRVPIIPGNHDSISTLHLGSTLSAWYRRCADVEIKNGPRTRKYIRHGCVLLGYTHGGRDDPRPDKLPLIMAQERPDDWAATTWREWHTGHLHTRREYKHTAGDTHNGVHVRVIPSLSGTDAWHYQHGFVQSPRTAEAFLWSRARGYLGHASSVPAIS